MSDCDICCRPFTKAKRIPLECSNCNEKLCKECVMKFITSSKSLPSCMHCKHPYELTWLYEVLPKTFMNKTYKDHVYDLIMTHEKHRLPELVPVIAREKKIDELIQLKSELLVARSELTKKIKKLNIAISNEQREIQRPSEPEKVMKVSVFPCPSDCRGFLGEDFSCGLCKKEFCKKCHKENHEGDCDPNEVESVKEIKKNSKPCPSCGTRISKVSGCDQMWCIYCQTAFSWNTGKIQTGVIHNPHYFDQLRNRGVQMRAPGDIPCGGIQPREYLFEWKSELAGKVVSAYNLVSSSVQRLQHISQVVIAGMNEFNLENHKRELRKKYLKEEIDEVKWRNELAKAYKKVERNNYYRQLMGTLTDASFELFRQMKDGRSFIVSDVNLDEILGQFLELVKYMNEQFVVYGKIFTCTAPKITIGEDFRIV